MVKAGTPRPSNSAAHHIVGDTSKRAKIARDILRKHGIDIDDALNGVFLPNRSNMDKTARGILHNGKHPNAYFDSVNDLIRNADNAGGKEAVLKTIDRIKNRLLESPRDASWGELFG